MTRLRPGGSVRGREPWPTKGYPMSQADIAVDGPTDTGRRVSDWIARNLTTQGYCLGAEERTQLWVALRFATGLCLPLVAAALVLESLVLLLALASIGAVAGLAPRHPFDLLWNHGVRHISAAPPLPPNPVRRRHAFKIGAAWLLTVAALFAADLPAGAWALGGILIAACGLTTTVNFCVPSFALSLLERTRTRSATPGSGPFASHRDPSTASVPGARTQTTAGAR